MQEIELGGCCGTRVQVVAGSGQQQRWIDRRNEEAESSVSKRMRERGVEGGCSFWSEELRK